MSLLEELADQWLADLDRARTGPLTLAQQQQIMAARDPRLAMALAANPAVLPTIQRAMIAQQWCWKALLANPNVTRDVQVTLAGRGYSAACMALLAREQVHPDAQQKLAKVRDPKVRRALARHPALDAAALEVLIEGAGEAMTAHLAANPSVAGPQLARWARSTSRTIRGGAARNPNLDPADQLRLTRDRSAIVRRHLAGNPAITRAAVEVLVADGDGSVRAALAGCTGLAADTIDTLLKDPDLRVVQGVAANPLLSPASQRRLASTADTQVRAALAANPALEPALQPELVDDASWSVLVDRQDLLPELQQVILGERYIGSRQALAARTGLSGSVRRSLARDGAYPDVVRTIIGRSDFDRTDLLDVLFGQIADPAPRFVRWCNLNSLPFGGPPGEWNRRFLDHRIVGPAAAARTGRRWVLASALLHDDPLVRIGGLANPAIELSQVKVLLHDPVPEVAEAARLAVLRGIAGRAL